MRAIALTLSICLGLAQAANARKVAQPRPTDTALANQFGADEHGMRTYVLVILKTGPHRVPDGRAREEMFKGHFANIKRLATEGKLAIAGPFGDKNDWRGMFIFAVDDPDEAQALVATDPVIKSGEMVAEYHRLYASAALMGVNALHQKIAPPE